MEFKISNKKHTYKLVALVGIASFIIIFLSTIAVLGSVYGFKPGDPGFKHYKNAAGQDNTPFEDIVKNGCMTQEGLDAATDTQFTFDTRDLSDFGNILINPDLCIQMAKDAPGYKITSIDVYDEKGNMKITVTKK